MKNKNDASIINGYSRFGAAYAVGTALLLAMGGKELPLLKFLGYSFVFFLFGMVIMAIGEVAAGMATEKGSKWVKRLKLVATMVIIGFCFYMIAGGNL